MNKSIQTGFSDPVFARFHSTVEKISKTAPISAAKINEQYKQLRNWSNSDEEETFISFVEFVAYELDKVDVVDT